MARTRYLPFSIERPQTNASHAGSAVDHDQIVARTRKIRGDDRQERTSFALQQFSWMGVACFVMGGIGLYGTSFLSLIYWLSDSQERLSRPKFQLFEDPNRFVQSVFIFFGGWVMVALSLIVSIAQQRRIPYPTLVMNFVYLVCLVGLGVSFMVHALD